MWSIRNVVSIHTVTNICQCVAINFFLFFYLGLALAQSTAYWKEARAPLSPSISKVAAYQATVVVKKKLG
jgi:hypothetical protein